MDRVGQAVRQVDYDEFVLEHDGSKLAQSSAPEIIERMLRLADVRPGQRVLEIGTGSGYSAALLATLVGPNGHVVSIDIDPTLVGRAQQRHVATTNLTILARDGAAGAADHAPYDRIIGWTTPDLLPAAWLAQTANRALIVTPVKVAPVAAANLVARIPVDAGRPGPTLLHEGSFVDCAPQISYEFALPTHHVDATMPSSGGTAWLSAATLRDQPARARYLLEQLVTNPTITSHDLDGSAAIGALARHMFATATEVLATAGLPDSGRGFGIATLSGVAVLLPRAYHSAGDDDALTRLSGTVAEWESLGRPDHAQLRAVLMQTDRGWSVRAIAASGDVAQQTIRSSAG